MRHSKLYALALLGTALLLFSIEPSQAADQLYVTAYTDKPSYLPGELVSITGQVLDANSMAVPFASVSVQANDPGGLPIHMALLLSSADGNFADQFTVPSSSVNGGYTIYVTVSKPGYIDAYSQAACIITPEFSHVLLLGFFIAVLAVLLAIGKKKPSKSALQNRGPSPRRDHSKSPRSTPQCNSIQVASQRSECES